MFTSSLFGDSAHGLFEEIRHKLVQEIDQISGTDIERADAENLAHQFEERYSVVCPRLSADFEIAAPEFTTSDRITVTVYVSFTGDATLFRYNGGSHPILTETIRIEPSQLVIQLPVDRQQIAGLEEKVRALLSRIEDSGLQPLRYFVRSYAVGRLGVTFGGPGGYVGAA